MKHNHPSDAYEEFRRNYEYSEGETRLKPWALLDQQEKIQWAQQFENYHGIEHTTDGKDGVSHGDPEITRRHRPRS